MRNAARKSVRRFLWVANVVCSSSLGCNWRFRCVVPVLVWYSVVISGYNMLPPSGQGSRPQGNFGPPVVSRDHLFGASVLRGDMELEFRT